jgi:L-threonylcarbamoyladenylate synthase
LQAQAVQGIFAAKGRPYSDPLIVHIAEYQTLETLVTHIPHEAHQVAEKFWPGPLTLVLPAHERVPHIVTAGNPTVAVRMPRHPVALALIRAAGTSIAAPSANRFMHVSPTTAQHAFTDLQGRVPLILDAGPCEIGVESTVLDLTGEFPTVLRPGGISLEMLRSVLPFVEYRKPGFTTQTTVETDEMQKSPGQMLIHYAPTVPAYLFEGPTPKMRAAMLATLRQQQAQGQRIGILIADEDVDVFAESGADLYVLGSLDHPEQVAAHLFAGLRTLEEAGVQVILCRTFAEQGIGLAIQDRLLKATGSKIITAS